MLESIYFISYRDILLMIEKFESDIGQIKVILHFPVDYTR